VGFIAAVIAIAWFVLFSRHILAPPMTVPAGPTIPEISKQFEEQVEAFNRLIPAPSAVPTPPITSDNQRLAPGS
jgi:hypothetical protein